MPLRFLFLLSSLDVLDVNIAGVLCFNFSTMMPQWNPTTLEEVKNVCHTTIVQNAWASGQSLSVHGVIYGLPEANQCYHCSMAQKMWVYQQIWKAQVYTYIQGNAKVNEQELCL